MAWVEGRRIEGRGGKEGVLGVEKQGKNKFPFALL